MSISQSFTHTFWLYMHIFKKHILKLILAVVVAIGTAYLYSKYTTPIYQASAVMLYKAPPTSIVNTYKSFFDSRRDKAALFQSQIKILKAHSTLKVIYDTLSTESKAAFQPASPNEHIPEEESTDKLITLLREKLVAA